VGIQDEGIELAILGGRKVDSVWDIMCNKSYGVLSLRSIFAWVVCCIVVRLHYAHSGKAR
jgi:hypothetical protein